MSKQRAEHLEAALRTIAEVEASDARAIARRAIADWGRGGRVETGEAERTITLELQNPTAEALEVLMASGDAGEALAWLAVHVAQGVTRPGSWERHWLLQAFGDEFLDRLEPDPNASWRMRPRR